MPSGNSPSPSDGFGALRELMPVALTLGAATSEIGMDIAALANVRFAPRAVVQRIGANRFSKLAAQLCSEPPDFHLYSSVQVRFGETGYDGNSLSGGA
jgi:hypothetical protein